MNQERYHRHIILPGFGLEAQKKLGDSKVLVIGAGGLGVPVLTYLNAMGVGTLGVVDSDIVSLSNLHRQVLYSENDVGRPKVIVALEKLEHQNSETQLNGNETFLTKENALEIITEYDVVVDASDNFPTRYLVNDACVILKKPFVYGALHGFEGQISVFNHESGPTYRCLFPTMPKSDEVPDCNENGVLGILPGIIGNLQALETVKVLTGVGDTLSGKLLLFDALTNAYQKIKFSVRPENQRITALKSDYDFNCGVGIKSMDLENFFQLMEAESPQLVDVRTSKEFKRNHLSIAKNIPLADLETREHEIDFEVPVYLVCQSGIRSKKAIEKLLASRPEAELINLDGGMNQVRSHGATA